MTKGGVPLNVIQVLTPLVLSLSSNFYDPRVLPKPFVQHVDWCPISKREAIDLVAPLP